MKKINPNKWIQLRKRAARNHPFVLSLMFDYLVTNRIVDIYGSPPIEHIHFFEGGEFNAQFFPVRTINNFGKSIIRKIVKDVKFTPFLISRAKKIAKRMAIDLNKLEEINLKKISDKKLYQLYLKFVNYYRRLALFSIPLWLLGEQGLSAELKKILEKKKIREPQLSKISTTLTSPTVLLFITREEIETLKLAQKVKKKINITKDLKRLANYYGFFSYDYSGPKIKKATNYLKEIKKLAKKPELAKEILKKQNYFKRLKRQQKEIFKKLRFNQGEKNIAIALQHAAILQDLRKECNSLFNFKTEILLKKVGRRLDIDFQLARYILPNEMKEILKSRKADREFLRTRRKLCVIYGRNEKSEIYTGKEMKPFLIFLKDQKVERVSEINGQVASVGWAKGRARVIKIEKEVRRFKKGEILVTPMTMPGFMPAIQKSAAIVTDEGGITCHAAIVSRELSIPCIIGTKIATKVLKDGDLVEIDADKGVVKILKK